MALISIYGEGGGLKAVALVALRKCSIMSHFMFTHTHKIDTLLQKKRLTYFSNNEIKAQII